MALALGASLARCADSPTGSSTVGMDAGCAWGRCATGGIHCVVSGVADGTWLTADFPSFPAPGCSAIPAALLSPFTPGRFSAGPAPIGELRCEGLRPGPATLHASLRVRLLDSRFEQDAGCYCGEGWNVSISLVVDGNPAFAVDGLHQGLASADGSCRRGPEVDQSWSVQVGADGSIRARVVLDRCDRYEPTSCVFLAGSRVEVVQ